MTIYNYIALKDGKEFVNGRIEANSEKHARELIRKMDLLPTKIMNQEVENTKEEEQTILQKGLSKKHIPKLSLREKIDFTNTLKILLKTGVPLVESMLFIESNEFTKNVRLMAQELRKQIITGIKLADAISKYSNSFDNIYCGLIKAGEESGELDVTLDRTAVLLEKQASSRSKIIGVMIYPVFVIFLAIVIQLIMLLFVFPSFKDMYSNMGKSLPLITSILMNLGDFLTHYYFLVPIIVIAPFYFAVMLFKWPPSKKIIDKLALKIPLVSSFVKFAALANFISVMHVAYESGVTVIDGLYLANMTVHNYSLNSAIKDVTKKVQRGMHLSAALKSTKVMPTILLFMVSTGEQSGTLGEMLKQASDYIDLELEKIISNITKLIEPSLLVVIGSIVLVNALALYLPLFMSYTNIG